MTRDERKNMELTKEQRGAGFAITDQDDTIYVLLNGAEIARFPSNESERVPAYVEWAMRRIEEPYRYDAGQPEA